MAGQVNQDALASSRTEDGRQVFGAVADGHGAPQHYRSHVGASLAVEVAQSVLEETAGFPDDTVVPLLIGEWNHAVDIHRFRDPVTGNVRHDTRGRVPYGTTLLAARIDETSVRLVQIGDGAICIGYGDGRIEVPFEYVPPAGHRVDSLCSYDAVLRARCRTISDSLRPDFVMLATDGFTESFRERDAIGEAANRLRDFIGSDEMDINKALFECLRNMAEWGNGDDSTIWLAMRTDSCRTGANRSDTRANP